MKFKARPYKTGGSWAVIIPADFIEQGYINVNEEQEVDMNEAKRK